MGNSLLVQCWRLSAFTSRLGVQSLVRELRSSKSLGMAPQKRATNDQQNPPHIFLCKILSKELWLFFKLRNIYIYMKYSVYINQLNSILTVFLHTNQLLKLGSWWNNCNFKSVSIAIKMANTTYTETPSHTHTPTHLHKDASVHTHTVKHVFTYINI